MIGHVGERIGFTGRRTPLAPAQLAALRHRVVTLSSFGATQLHHGDCVGADAAAHGVAVDADLRTVVHPPVNPTLRAWCRGDEIHSPRPYTIRNRNIVHATTLLIACPDGPERVRSGTWSTVRYARRHGTPRIVIIYPDGRIVYERWHS